jgi:hypothetical protein
MTRSTTVDFLECLLSEIESEIAEVSAGLERLTDMTVHSRDYPEMSRICVGETRKNLLGVAVHTESATRRYPVRECSRTQGSSQA